MIRLVLDKAKRWLEGRRSSQLMSLVMELMTEARQKLRVSDSPFCGLARTCIDRAEDSYQEAIYNLKDGSVSDTFDYCRRSLKYLALAMTHLATADSLKDHPDFPPGSPEEVVLELARSIARFKTVVEYTNCEISKACHEQVIEVVEIFFQTIDMLKSDRRDAARRHALAGLLWVYTLGKEIEPAARTSVIDDDYIRKVGDSDIDRVADLVNAIHEVETIEIESTEYARHRIGPYLSAARETLRRCLNMVVDGESIGQVSKAGIMEVRMARKLLESSTQSGVEAHKAIDEESPVDSRIETMRRRIAKVQRLLKDNDPDSPRIVRRLQQVGAYYGKAVRLAADGSSNEAERYARSAHLDIDYARQLQDKESAFFSDAI